MLCCRTPLLRSQFLKGVFQVLEELILTSNEHTAFWKCFSRLCVKWQNGNYDSCVKSSSVSENGSAWTALLHCTSQQWKTFSGGVMHCFCTEFDWYPISISWSHAHVCEVRMLLTVRNVVFTSVCNILFGGCQPDIYPLDRHNPYRRKTLSEIIRSIYAHHR